MLRTGAYYLWLPKAYPGRNFGQSITQQVFVGSHQRFASSDQKASATMLTNVQRSPWGYSCRIQPNFQQLPSKSLSIDNQLKLVKECVKRHVEYHKLALVLRPLELVQFWSEDLQVLIEQYLEVEEMVYHEGLKRKCEWLLKLIEERKIDIVKEGVRFRAEKTGHHPRYRYRSTSTYPWGGAQIVLIQTKEFKDPAVEYILRRLSVSPIFQDYRTRVGEERSMRVQGPDIVLFYPVFEVLIPGLEEYVNELGLRKMVDERWRMFH